MKVPLVDLHAQYLTIKDEIDAAISSVIADSAYIGGAHVEGFERAWAKAAGARHCVSCANGTDALMIAIRALGLKPGDEVITTAHTWISTSAMITQAGGRVVFCDVDPVTFTIDPAQLEARITPRTVGIIPVHLYGQPADMDPIMAIAGAAQPLGRSRTAPSPTWPATRAGRSAASARSRRFPSIQARTLARMATPAASRPTTTAWLTGWCRSRATAARRST